MLGRRSDFLGASGLAGGVWQKAPSQPAASAPSHELRWLNNVAGSRQRRQSSRLYAGRIGRTRDQRRYLRPTDMSFYVD